MPMIHWLLFPSLLVLALLQPSVRAADLIELAAGEARGQGWAASDLNVTTRLNPDNSLALDLRSSLLKLASSEHELEDVRWQCQQLLQVDKAYACEQSQLVIGRSPLGSARFILDWRFSDMDNWRISLHRAGTDAGSLQGELSMHQGRWQGVVSGQQMQLDKLLQLLPITTRAGWSLSGEASFKVDFSGVQAELQKLSLELKGRKVAYADAEGLQAGENVGLGLDLSAESLNGRWSGVLGLSVDQGQLYSDPVYLKVGEKALGLHGRFEGHLQQGWVQLHGAMFKLPGVANAGIEARMQQGRWSDLELEFEAPDLSGLYRVLAQPFLIGTALDDLSLRGSGKGQLQLNNDELTALDLSLQQVDVEDKRGRFGIRQLDTELHWLNQGKALPSSLSAAGGHLFRMDLGQVQANIRVNDGQLLVEDKVSMPLLGGELSLNNLVLEGLSAPPLNWQLAMTAKKIQLDALSKALDWPPLSGRLDGHIPSVRYGDGKVLLDGELVVDVFGGRVIVDGLQIAGPMGVAPVLETRLRLQDLDLAQLTGAFSFGRIDGLLAGEIDELQLVGWQLNRFRAGIRTPEHDKSKRRISQRAIDNLTSLGTGMSAGLSGTALRMFKDFAYDKIALEVDLTGDMASLDGIPYKDGGYYIVKGAGLPRIDVIGRTREIAWKDLVSRIQNARFSDMVIE